MGKKLMAPGAVKYSVKVRKLVKTIHVYLAAIWGGGSASLFVVHCLFIPGSGPELYARNMILIYIDNFVIIPASVGCFVTGLLLCHLTKLGYWDRYWIIVKWVANLVLTFAGLFWFIPWLREMVILSESAREVTVIPPVYMTAMDIHMIMAVCQTLLIFLLMIISFFKPWGKNTILKRKNRLESPGK